MQSKPISKNEKLEALCSRLKEDYINDIPRIEEHKQTYRLDSVNYYIKRHTLKQIIQEVLMITHTYTINSWINLLLALDIVRPNPHTQLSAVKGLVKPSNDTRYTLNIEVIDQILDRNTHTPKQTSLSKFLKPS